MDCVTTGETSATVARDGYCPYCSHPPHSFIYHGGHCPLVKAKEYHPGGRLKRVEFHHPSERLRQIYEINLEVSPKSRIPGLHQGRMKIADDFDAPLIFDEGENE